jgi:hypothetical protein
MPGRMVVLVIDNNSFMLKLVTGITRRPYGDCHPRAILFPDKPDFSIERFY